MESHLLTGFLRSFPQWLRDFRIRKGRECIIPDVSRTYHLGIKGSNMNYDFHKLYFENRALNQIDFVNLTDVDRLIELNYELHILDLIKRARVINEFLDVKAINGDPKASDHKPDKEEKSSRKNQIKSGRQPTGKKDTFCSQLHRYFERPSAAGQADNEPHVLYIGMKHEQDFDGWLKCASCFSLWDLDGDPRGMHKGKSKFPCASELISVARSFWSYATPKQFELLKLIHPIVSQFKECGGSF